MTRRRRKVRWPRCCARCRAYLTSGHMYSDDHGATWICQDCAMTSNPEGTGL